MDFPEYLQCESMIKIMKNPRISGGEEYCRFPNKETIITEQYAYVEYFSRNKNKYLSNMLFNYSKDPNENLNVADKLEYIEVLSELRTKVRKHIEEPNKSTYV